MCKTFFSWLRSLGDTPLDDGWIEVRISVHDIREAEDVIGVFGIASGEKMEEVERYLKDRLRDKGIDPDGELESFRDPETLDHVFRQRKEHAYADGRISSDIRRS